MPNDDAPFNLSPARVHEAEGPGRRAFALLQAVRHEGPLIWALPAHAPHLPMLRGLPEGVGARLHVIRPGSEVDLLWSVEECLRSPGVALVIAEPSSSLSLIAGRRLQLAAEAEQPTGLMLIFEGQGSNAAETRWHCVPLAGDSRDSTPAEARQVGSHCPGRCDLIGQLLRAAADFTSRHLRDSNHRFSPRRGREAIRPHVCEHVSCHD